MKQRVIPGITKGVPRRSTQLVAPEVPVGTRRIIKGMTKGAQLLVRDVPFDVVEALKRRAAEHGRSAEAEHRLILEEMLRPGRSDFWERAAELREETRGRILTDSTELIRRDRDER